MQAFWPIPPARFGRAAADARTAGVAVSDVVEDRDVRTFGVALVLSTAWAASIGGLGTLLGSPPNAIAAGYISGRTAARREGSAAQAATFSGRRARTTSATSFTDSSTR